MSKNRNSGGYLLSSNQNSNSKNLGVIPDEADKENNFRRGYINHKLDKMREQLGREMSNSSISRERKLNPSKALDQSHLTNCASKALATNSFLKHKLGINAISSERSKSPNLVKFRSCASPSKCRKHKKYYILDESTLSMNNNPTSQQEIEIFQKVT